jgi:hypothetical protein
VAPGITYAIELPEEINHQRRRFFGNAAMDQKAPQAFAQAVIDVSGF